MNASTRQCPFCKTPLFDTDVNFCSSCNADLSQDRGTAETIIPDSPTTPILPKESCPIPGNTPIRVAEKPSQQRSQCADLEVLYNSGSIFMEGYILPFQFRITPLCDGISEVHVEVRSGNYSVMDTPGWEWERGMETSIPVGFRAPAGFHGKVPFDIYIGIKKGDQQYWFLSKKIHTIFRAKEKVGKVIETIKIELTNSITQGNADDVGDVDQHIEGLEKLCPKPDDPAGDLQSIDLPPYWEELPLKKCKPPLPLRPLPRSKPDEPPAEALKDRLTLSIGGQIVHILSTPIIKLGRNKQNDMVTRLASASGRDHKENIGAISRFHCRIELAGDTCAIVDKGWYPDENKFQDSACGTFMDGKRIPHGQSKNLPGNSDFYLSLAGADTGDPATYSFQCRLWTCDAMQPVETECREAHSINTPACLVLKPQANANEIFVLLWHHMKMNIVVPSFGVECLCRHKNAFLIRQASGCDWLVPGHDLNLKSGLVQVEDYNQKIPSKGGHHA